MTDTFKLIFGRPADDTLFREAAVTICTPTGSIETYKIPESRIWRDLDNEHSIRTYAEHRLIKAFPLRSWHGSRVVFFNRNDNGSLICVVDVDCDELPTDDDGIPYLVKGGRTRIDRN